MDQYARFGASSSKEDVHKAIENLDKGIAPGAFCKVLPDFLGGDAAFVNALHADGAGTKSVLAYLYWKETGDLSVWRGIAQDSVVMNLDDLLCVGASGDFVLSSTIGRNRRLIPGEVLRALIEGTESFCASLRDLGVPVYFAGGETADMGDVVRTIVVDSALACRFPRRNLIVASAIRPGDRLIGLSSSGQAAYEEEWNSGIASNGLTLVRHVLLSSWYSTAFPESIDPVFEASGGYRGRFRLTDTVLSRHGDLGKGLLSPTRTYAPFFAALWKNTDREQVSGIVHNTGGGHSKVAHFIRGAEVEKNPEMAMPEVFGLIQKEAGLGDEEMWKTFNCGIRMEIYCRPALADTVHAVARQFGIESFDLGEVRASANPGVRIRSGGRTWTYPSPPDK